MQALSLLVTHIENHKEGDEEEESLVSPSPHPLPCHLHGVGLPQSNKTVHEPLLVQELQEHDEACMRRRREGRRGEERGRGGGRVFKREEEEGMLTNALREKY